MNMQDIFDSCSKNKKMPVVRWTGAISKKSVVKEHTGQMVSVTYKPDYQGVAVLFDDVEYELHFYLTEVPIFHSYKQLLLNFKTSQDGKQKEKGCAGEAYQKTSGKESCETSKTKTS